MSRRDTRLGSGGTQRLVVPSGASASGGFVCAPRARQDWHRRSQIRVVERRSGSLRRSSGDIQAMMDGPRMIWWARLVACLIYGHSWQYPWGPDGDVVRGVCGASAPLVVGNGRSIDVRGSGGDDQPPPQDPFRRCGKERIRRGEVSHSCGCAGAPREVFDHPLQSQHPRLQTARR